MKVSNDRTKISFFLFFIISHFTVDSSTVCVSIEVNGFENGTPTYTEFYHISDNKVTGASQWPTYKREGGDEYIYYFPDAYGWRIGELFNGTEQSTFNLESKIDQIVFVWQTIGN